jgi:hypothetical protein
VHGEKKRKYVDLAKEATKLQQERVHASYRHFLNGHEQLSYFLPGLKISLLTSGVQYFLVLSQLTFLEFNSAMWSAFRSHNTVTIRVTGGHS